MGQRATTPEELETLLEDAFVLHDRDALVELFDDGAVLLAGGSPSEARGSEAIGSSADALWRARRTYVAEPRRVVQARDTALVLAAGALNVLRRGGDGAWRYAISVLSFDTATSEEEQMTEQTEQTSEPVRIPSDGGEARWWFDALAVIKCTAADTGGQMTIVEMTYPPNADAPLHVHHREDEAFWMLEGSATFQVGEQALEGGAGDYLFGPRDIPHKFTVGPDGCRLLFICIPGGNFEDLVREMSVPAEQRTVPPPSDEEPDLARIAAIAEGHGCELLA